MMLRSATILLALSLAGCTSLRVAPERRPLDGALFPLTPGSSWVYEVRDFAGRVSELRARVNREVAGAGGNLTLVEEICGIPGEPGFDSGHDLVVYYSTAGFIFRAPWYYPASAPPPTGAGEPILPVDVARSASWHGSHSILAIDGPPLYELRTESRVTATAEAIDVPAGSFAPCLRVDTVVVATDPSAEPKREIVYYYTDWYAPGVGLVRTTSAVDVDGRKRDVLSLDLASFSSARSPAR